MVGLCPFVVRSGGPEMGLDAPLSCHLQEGRLRPQPRPPGALSVPTSTAWSEWCGASSKGQSWGWGRGLEKWRGGQGPVGAAQGGRRQGGRATEHLRAVSPGELSTLEGRPPGRAVQPGGLSTWEGHPPGPRSTFIFPALPAKEAPGVEVLPWLNVPSSHLRLENVGETHGEMCLKVWRH